MKKILIPIVIIVFVAGLVVMTSKNTIARVSIEKGVEMVTGLRLTIAKLDVGIITTLVGIQDLKLFNPPQFEDRVMLDMPEIFVDYNLPGILKGKIHLNKVKIDMKEFTVVKNAKGELNLNSLNVVKDQKKTTPAEPKEKMGMQIDSLELKIGKVIYKDYSRGGKPQVQEFNVDINEKFSNINEPNKLVSLMVVRALSKTTIARLADFDIQGLQEAITDTLGSAQKVVGGVADAGKTLTETASQMKTVIADTTETTKAAVQELAEAIKLPFGAKEE